MPYYDVWGIEIRVPEERLEHSQRTEVVGEEVRIAATLLEPDFVRFSNHDDEARLYYRRFVDSPVGDKLFCVVVKWDLEDSFVLTVYLTSKPKRGLHLWPENTT